MRTLSRKFALAMLMAMLVQISSPYLYLTSTLVFAESSETQSEQTSTESSSESSEQSSAESSSSEQAVEPAPEVVEEEATEQVQQSASTTSASTGSSSSASASSEGRVSSSFYDEQNKVFEVSPVELGTNYIFPGNKLVKIKFTRLPEVAGKLNIKEISLSAEQREALNSVSSKAYEFTSDMADGSFEYVITLPKGKAEKPGVKYAENMSGLSNPNSEDVAEGSETVSFSADHFTIFVVTDDQATTSGGAWDDFAGQGSTLDPSGGVHYPFFTTATGDITWGFAGLGLSNYDVYVSWSTHPNRTQTAEYTVNHLAGSQTFVINQELLADQSTVGGSGEFSGWYLLGNFQMDATSSVVLPTKDNASGTEYVIGDEVVLVNDSNNGTFIGSPRYVRENNAGDIAAQVHVDTLVEDVRFSVDGGAPIAGTFINAVNASLDRWRLLTPLAAGEHTVTAEVQILGTWYALAGSSTVYSLDLPSFEYIIPNTDPQYFRPTDNPLRIRVDDEFNQFESADLRVYDYNAGVRGALLFTYTVNRAECNLTQAGNYVLCDINDSLTWANLAEGRYQVDARTDTLANNGVRYNHANSDSLPFYVDATAPAVNSFAITTVLAAPFTVYSNQINVTADATDTAPGMVKHVEFYMRTPRLADGVCVDNNGAGPIIKLTNNAYDGDDTYTNSFDTSDLNGEYCLFAKAEDMAASHSVASSIKVNIDNIDPVVEITNPANGAVVSGTVAVRGSYTDENPLRYYIVVRNAANAVVAGPGTVNTAVEFTDQLLFNWNTTLVPDGVYTIYYAARDLANNRNDSLGSLDVHTVTVDNTDPDITDVKMFVNGVETTWVKAGDNVTWRYTITDANSIDAAASAVQSGNVADPVAQEITAGGFSSCNMIAGNTYECDYNFVMPAVYGDLSNITTVTNDQVVNAVAEDVAGNTSEVESLNYTYYIPGVIQGIKFRDVNMNGVIDAGENVGANRLNNWTIRLYDAGWNELEVNVTGDDADNFGNVGNGQYRFGDLLPGTYYVCEDLQTGWQQFRPNAGMGAAELNTVAADGTYCYEVTFNNNGGTRGGRSFGNIDLVNIQGRKIFDVDGDGQLYDQTINDSVRLDGWTVNLYNSDWSLNSIATTGTPAKGQYQFSNLLPGTYYVCEENQTDWVQTYPYAGAVLEDNSGNPVASALGVANASANAAAEAAFCWETTVAPGVTQSWVRFGNVETAEITFVKNVVDEAGEDDVDTTSFDIDLNGVGVKPFAEGTDAVFGGLLPGTYDFSEVIADASKYNLLGCEVGGVDAAGSVTVAAGDKVTVDCTNELVELPDVEVTPSNPTVVQNTDLLLTALIVNPGTVVGIPGSYNLEWQCVRMSDGVTVQGVTTDITKTVNFSRTGAFECTVTLTDANGDTDSATATINVIAATVDLQPQVVLFGTAPATNSGQINVAAGASFNVIASLSQNGNPAYTYQFGGVCAGNTNTNATSFASNTLSLAAGSYVCSVTVTDTDGDVDTASVTINVASTGGGIGNEGPIDEGSVQGETDGETPEEPVEEPTTPVGQACTTTVTVFGYMFVDLNSDAVVNSDDTRLGGLQVNIFTLNGEFVTSATTDSTGYWEKQICPGEYRFELANSNLPVNAQVLGANSRIETIDGNDQVDFVFSQVAGETTEAFNFMPWLLLLLILLFGGGLYAYTRNSQRQEK